MYFATACMKTPTNLEKVKLLIMYIVAWRMCFVIIGQVNSWSTEPRPLRREKPFVFGRSYHGASDILVGLDLGEPGLNPSLSKSVFGIMFHSHWH